MSPNHPHVPSQPNPARPPVEFDPDFQLNKRREWRGRIRGILMILSSLGVPVVGWLVLTILAANFRANPDAANDVNTLAMSIIHHRIWILLSSTPALVVGIALASSTRSARLSWGLIGLASLWLCAIGVLVIWTFIMCLAPMYQYKPL